MASRKRKRPELCAEVAQEAVKAYTSYLRAAVDILYASEFKHDLVTDESWEGHVGPDGQVVQVARMQNTRTVLALAEGVRLRRLDAADRE